MKVWHLYSLLLVQYQSQNWMRVFLSGLSVIFQCKALRMNKQRKHLMLQETVLSFSQLFYPLHPSKMLCRYFYLIQLVVIKPPPSSLSLLTLDFIMLNDFKFLQVLVLTSVPYQPCLLSLITWFTNGLLHYLRSSMLQLFLNCLWWHMPFPLDWLKFWIWKLSTRWSPTNEFLV